MSSLTFVGMCEAYYNCRLRVNKKSGGRCDVQYTAPTTTRKADMISKLLKLAAFSLLVHGTVVLAQINPTDPQPTCTMCPGTYIPLSELESYTKKALAEKLVDQQVRDIDIGKARIGIGVVHRGKLDQLYPVFSAILTLMTDLLTVTVLVRRFRACIEWPRSIEAGSGCVEVRLCGV